MVGDFPSIHITPAGTWGPLIHSPHCAQNLRRLYLKLWNCLPLDMNPINAFKKQLITHFSPLWITFYLFI